MPRNLLFITTDHQRFDSIASWQCGVELTPTLNRLAGENAHFLRAYDACPLCVPARTAMATGLYPPRNGVELNTWDGSLTSPNKTLHHSLAENGYLMGHFGRNHISVTPSLEESIEWAAWAGKADHLEHIGNDQAERARASQEHCLIEVEEKEGGGYVKQTYSDPSVAPWPLAALDHEDAFYTTRAIDFAKTQIAAQQECSRPFALFLNLWAPHPPLNPPPELLDLFPSEAIELPSNALEVPSDEPANRRMGIAAQMCRGLDEASLRETWSAHLALVHFADKQIGRLLDALDHLGLRDDLLVCFTSDHGDMLGQRSMYQKMELYESAARVPLILAANEIPAAKIENPVSHLDLYPTICDCLGIPGPINADGVNLHAEGRLEAPADRALFCQYRGNPALGDTRLGVVKGDWKYVYDPDDRAELYNLMDDPLEVCNLSGNAQYRVVEKQLLKAVSDHYGELVHV